MRGEGTPSGRRDLVITGMGAVTPLGVGVPAYTRGLRQGRSGVALLTFSDERLKSSVAARCSGFDPLSVLPHGDVPRVPAMIPMALAATREAIAQAGIALESLSPRDGLRRVSITQSQSLTHVPENNPLQPLPRGEASVGLILGTGGGGIDFTLAQAAAFHAGERTSLWTITNATHGNLAGELSIALGLRGPSLCVSTGCASSSDAMGWAMDLLRSDRPGTPDAMVVVGADAHVRVETLLGMELLRVISTRNFRDDPSAAHTASRPFDRARDGFVLGEGAWAVVLERRQHAEQRGASAIAYALGYGCTCDAYHRVRPAPNLVESARAIELALADAALAPEEVEVIHYHGTGTQLNDAVETAVVHKVFGAHAKHLRGHSVKSAIGHPQGACGLAALVATIGGLTNADRGAGAFLVPTINLNEPDPECDLEYTPNHARPTDASVALVNCLAFGAKNSALVVRAAPSRSL